MYVKDLAVNNLSVHMGFFINGLTSYKSSHISPLYNRDCFKAAIHYKHENNNVNVANVINYETIISALNQLYLRQRAGA